MPSNRYRKGGLLSGAAVYFISSLFNAAIPFILLPILTRHLEPDEYGQLAMFQVLVLALTAFVGLNTVGAANRRFFDQDGAEGTAEYLGSCMMILCLSFLATLLVLFPLLPFLSDFLGLSPVWIMLAPATSAAMFIVRLRLGQWRVRQQPIPFGALEISMGLLNAGLSILLVVALSYGAEGRITGLLAATTLMAPIALWLLYRDGLFRFTYSKKRVREALDFGVPYIPHVVGSFLLVSADRVIINEQLGLALAGIYMVGVQISKGVAICVDAFNKSYSPWLMRQLKKDKQHINAKIVRLTYLYFAAAIACATLSFIVGPVLVSIMAGDKYAAAGEIVGFLLAGQCIRGMYTMVVNYILYARRTGRLSLLTGLSGGLNIALLFALIPPLGITGAGHAFLISSIFLFLGGWAIAARSHPMPWFRYA